MSDKPFKLTDHMVASIIGGLLCLSGWLANYLISEAFKERDMVDARFEVRITKIEDSKDELKEKLSEISRKLAVQQSILERMERRRKRNGY